LAALILLCCANDLPVSIGITATSWGMNAKATTFTPRIPFPFNPYVELRLNFSMNQPETEKTG
jgi:hypothetical protein